MDNRIKGCLIGALVGDALGAPYEFDKSPEYKGMISGGYHKTKLGQITDDGELTLALARSIVENNGYNKEKVAEKYYKWFCSNPFDIGKATKFAFQGGSNYQRMSDNAIKYNSKSLSNGFLMRSSPLGIANLTTTFDCDLTNPHFKARQAQMTYARLINSCIHDVDVGIYLDQCYQSFDSSINNQGYYGTALKLTLNALESGKGFEQSMIDIIKHGHDTDTNACIAGAVLGAYYGLDNIPKEWVDNVKNCKTDRQLSFPECKTDDIEELAMKLFNL